MTSTSQSGSTVGFVIVGILLTAALLGGIYAVRYNGFGRVAWPGSAQQTAKNDAKTNPNKPQATPKSASEKANKSQEAAEQQIIATRQAEALHKAEMQRQTASQTQADSQSVTPSTQVPSVTPSNQSSNQTAYATTGASLPETGPSEMLASVVGFALLVSASVAYYQSLRDIRGSL